MDTESISASYARALLELAEAKSTVEELGGDMSGFDALIRAYPPFGDFLATPKVAWEVKMDIVTSVLGREVSETFLSFLRLVLRRNRGVLLGEIADLFRREVDRLTGRARAFVKTAVPLEDGSKKRLTEVLKKKLSMEVVLEEKVDPAILGGLRVRVGDSLLDGTLLSRLEKLKQLMGAGKLEGEVIYED